MGSERIWERGAALTSRLQSFETEQLTKQRTSLLGRNQPELIARAETIESPQRWCWTWIRRRFRSTGSRNRAPTTNTTNRPAITRLLLFNARATVLRRNCGRVTCIVRKTGQNCYYGDRAPAKTRQGSGVRADAAFAKPEIYDALEERGVKYAIGFPRITAWSATIAELLTRPVGRPSHKPVVVVQGLSLSSRQLEDGAAGSGESRVFTLGSVPASGFYRDQPGGTEPDGGAVLQQARDGGAVDQGGQAGGEDDAVVLPSFPLQPGAAALSLLLHLGNLWRRLALPTEIENCR